MQSIDVETIDRNISLYQISNISSLPSDLCVDNELTIYLISY